MLARDRTVPIAPSRRAPFSEATSSIRGRRECRRNDARHRRAASVRSGRSPAGQTGSACETRSPMAGSMDWAAHPRGPAPGAHPRRQQAHDGKARQGFSGAALADDRQRRDRGPFAFPHSSRPFHRGPRRGPRARRNPANGRYSSRSRAACPRPVARFEHGADSRGTRCRHPRPTRSDSHVAQLSACRGGRRRRLQCCHRLDDAPLTRRHAGFSQLEDVGRSVPPGISLHPSTTCLVAMSRNSFATRASGRCAGQIA